MLNFLISNIKFTKSNSGVGVKMTGEALNCMNVNYSSVAFRAVIFSRSTPMANFTFTINGFNSKQAKTFEIEINDIPYNDGIDRALKAEIYVESAY